MQDYVIRKPELKKTLKLSDTTIWRMERDGRFPKRLQLGSGSVGWLASEVKAWLEARAANRFAVPDHTR